MEGGIRRAEKGSFFYCKMVVRGCVLFFAVSTCIELK